VRIGVAATPDVAIPTLNWLLQSEHVIDLIITQPDRPAGRGRLLQQSAVSDWTATNQIAVLKPEDSQELIGKIEHLDLVLTIGYGVLLPLNVLVLPKFGFLNLHFSLLPAYRGAAPAQRALLNGDTMTGVSVFQLEKGMDTGPIFAQETLEIKPSWRSFELLRHLADLGPSVVQRSLEMIKNGESPKAQAGAVSIAAKIEKAEARLDFTKAYEPGAWTLWRGEPFKICSTGKSNSSMGTPGEVSIIDKSVFVSCENGSLEILRVVPAGKKEMDAIDWARGARLNIGEVFG